MKRDLSEISRIISDYYEVDNEMWLQKNGNGKIREAKRMFCFYCLKVLSIDLDDVIGFTNLDRTTLIHHRQKGIDFSQCDLKFKSELLDLRIKIDGYFFELVDLNLLNLELINANKKLHELEAIIKSLNKQVLEIRTKNKDNRINQFNH